MTPEERKKYATRWVNARRKEGGLRGTRLTKGYRAHASLCTIAKSLEKVGVTAADYDGPYVILRGETTRGEESSRQWNDPTVTRFMLDFDNGEYPELVIPPTPLKIGKKVVG
jgi:hypothetical protein